MSFMLMVAVCDGGASDGVGSDGLMLVLVVIVGIVYCFAGNLDGDVGSG